MTYEPRSPAPTSASAIRSLAPRMREYDSAVKAEARVKLRRVMLIRVVPSGDDSIEEIRPVGEDAACRRRIPLGVRNKHGNQAGAASSSVGAQDNSPQRKLWVGRKAKRAPGTGAKAACIRVGCSKLASGLLSPVLTDSRAAGAYRLPSDSGGFSTDPQDAHIHGAH